MGVNPSRRHPNPKLAGWLSAFLPGLGQIYLGSILLGAVLLGGWILAVFGMMDLLDSRVLREKPYWAWLVAADLAIGAGAWVFGIRHALWKARRMDRHAGVYRGLVRQWTKGRLKLIVPDLVLALFFFLVAAGRMAEVPLAVRGAQALFCWFGYEIFGAIFLTFLLACLDILEVKERPPAFKILYVLVFYLLFTAGLKLLFVRIPLSAIALSGLVLLPGQILSLLASENKARRQLAIEGGITFCSLVLSFFLVAFGASLLEAAGMREGRGLAFDAILSMAWGASHYLLKSGMILVADIGPEEESKPGPL
jgi:hypothetical protein